MRRQYDILFLSHGQSLRWILKAISESTSTRDFEACEDQMLSPRLRDPQSNTGYGVVEDGLEATRLANVLKLPTSETYAVNAVSVMLCCCQSRALIILDVYDLSPICTLPITFTHQV